MKKFIAISENNPDHDWCREYGISLLPYPLSSDKLTEYFKNRFNLTDEEFNQLLIDNGIDSINTENGSLEMNHFIFWDVAIADIESKSGNYLGIVNNDDYTWRLFPKEDLPHNVVSYLKEKVAVSDDELYAVFAEKDYLDDDDNIDLPYSGSIYLKDIEFYWDMCRVER